MDGNRKKGESADDGIVPGADVTSALSLPANTTTEPPPPPYYQACSPTPVPVDTNQPLFKSNSTTMATPTPTPCPSVAIGSIFDIFHPYMTHAASTLFFQQESVVELDRMVMIQVHNHEERLLFSCAIRRIPRPMNESATMQAVIVNAFNTEYTVTDTLGQTVLVGYAENNSMRVTAGDGTSLGFIDDGGTNGTRYKGFRTSGVGAFTMQKTGNEEFTIVYNGARGHIGPKATNCAPNYIRVFPAVAPALEFPATEMDPRLKALMFASGLLLYDKHFMRTTTRARAAAGFHEVALDEVQSAIARAERRNLGAIAAIIGCVVVVSVVGAVLFLVIFLSA